MTIRQLAFPRKRTAVVCDESGICELADELAIGSPTVARKVIGGSDWSVVVDIAPVTVGHYLFLPHTHSINSVLLGRRKFVRHSVAVDAAISESRSRFTGSTIALEHGSGTSAPSSCVRHAHTHICPVSPGMATVDAVITVIKEYADILAVADSWYASHRLVPADEGYLLIRADDGIVLAQVNTPVRQVARVALHRLNGMGTDEVDWALSAEGPRFIQAMSLLGLGSYA